QGSFRRHDGCNHVTLNHGHCPREVDAAARIRGPTLGNGLGTVLQGQGDRCAAGRRGALGDKDVEGCRLACVDLVRHREGHGEGTAGRGRHGARGHDVRNRPRVVDAAAVRVVRPARPGVVPVRVQVLAVVEDVPRQLIGQAAFHVYDRLDADCSVRIGQLIVWQIFELLYSV